MKQAQKTKEMQYKGYIIPRPEGGYSLSMGSDRLNHIQSAMRAIDADIAAKAIQQSTH